MANAVSLASIDDELVSGRLVDRPNRFVVRVQFDDGSVKRVFLGDPGALENILEEGNRVLCRYVDDADRKTSYDAIGVDTGDALVSVRAAFANELFETLLEAGLYPPLQEYRSLRREPSLPDHGRSDFLVESLDGDDVWIEVKSCTHVEAGVAKFPDRQTERGRRHLESLRALVDDSTTAHIVFVVQHPLAEEFQPYRDVDPAFADLLADVQEAGVTIHAISTAFEPPQYRLINDDLPITIG